MKTILVYGDSNTWGYNPAAPTVRDRLAITAAGGPYDSGRYDRHTRWAGVLRDTLNHGSPPEDPAFWVIEAGLNGRTTVWDDPYEPHRNGAAALPAVLLSHMPLDAVVIMLGTNDLKRRFGLTAYDIATGAVRLAQITLDTAPFAHGKRPYVLLIAPPPPVSLASTRYEAMFAGADTVAAGFATAFPAVLERLAENAPAQAAHIAFFDAGTVAACSPLDGIHLERDAHRALGLAVAGLLAAALA
jgi:lysophospholipase L1-like esterase